MNYDRGYSVVGRWIVLVLFTASLLCLAALGGAYLLAQVDQPDEVEFLP